MSCVRCVPFFAPLDIKKRGLLWEKGEKGTS